MTTHLFIIFVTTNLSKKLVDLILQGKIHAHIYSLTPISLKIKKMFSKHSNGNFRIYDLNMPYNFITFNFLLLSKSFWDNIPKEYQNIFILFNPKGLTLSIEFNPKTIEQFHFFNLTDQNLNLLIKENPSLVDEEINNGFFFYINHYFAKKTLKTITKTNILNIRKKFKMNNTEHIERQNMVPFYHYFYHNMITMYQ